MRWPCEVGEPTMATFKKSVKFKTQKRFNTEISAAAAAPVNRDDEVSLVQKELSEFFFNCELSCVFC